MPARIIPGDSSLAELANVIMRQEAIEGPISYLGIADDESNANHAAFLSGRELPNRIILVMVPSDSDLIKAIERHMPEATLVLVTEVLVANSIARVAMFRRRQ
jgi:hypothetical protein